MNLRQLRISRRTIAVAVALAGTVSLAIGAHAALNKRSLDAAKAVTTEQATGAVTTGASHLALIIGNGHYPDASAPLAQPINDARTLSAALRHDGFDVDVVEDATRDDMVRAVERMKARIRPGTVVMLFFGGYGVQVGRELHDPGRRHDLEGIRRQARRRQRRIRARCDERAGRQDQARRA